MIGYKVVRNHGNRLSSAMITDTLYLPGRLALPPAECGPLAVFDTMIQAINFTKTLGDLWVFEVWRCKHESAREKYLWVKNPEFIRRVNGKEFHETRDNLPIGTVFASSIILLEKIWSTD